MSLTGKIQYDAEPTKQYVKGKLGEILDKGEQVSKEAMKASSAGFFPTMIDGVVSIMRFFYVPEVICKPVSAYGSPKIIEKFNPAIDSCAKATKNIAKQAFEKSADTSIDSSFSIWNWAASWF